MMTDSKRIIWMAALLFSAGVQAKSKAKPVKMPPVIEGITLDGQAFVYTTPESLWSDDTNGPGEIVCTASVQIVRQLESGAETKYLRGAEGEDCKGAAELKYKPMSELVAYVQAHPLAGPAAVKGKGSGTQLVVTGEPCSKIKCDSASCALDVNLEGTCALKDEGGRSVLTEVGIKHPNGKTFVLGSYKANDGSMGFHDSQNVRAYWLPGSTIAVLLIHSTTKSARDFRQSDEITVVHFDTIRVMVLGQGGRI